MIGHFVISFGWFGLRRLKLRFGLASIQNACAISRLELGEFFTSKALNEDQKTYLKIYGAYLNAKGKNHTSKSYKRFLRIYNRLTQKQISKIKTAMLSTEKVSEQMKEAIKNYSTEKKNS